MALPDLVDVLFLKPCLRFRFRFDFNVNLFFIPHLLIVHPAPFSYRKFKSMSVKRVRDSS